MAGGWGDYGARPPRPSHRAEANDGDLIVDDADLDLGFDRGAEGSGGSGDDTFVQQLLLDDPTEPDTDVDAASGAAALRLVKVVAVVGAAGWLITLLANVLSPSNLLDTTDRDDALAPVEFTDDLDAGIGGGIEGDTVDGLQAATVIRVDGTEGPVVGPGDGAESATVEPTASSSASSSAGAADGDVGSDGASADGQPTPAGPSASGNGAAPTSAAAGSPAGASATGLSGDYRSNLEMLRSASVRNRNHDGSAQRGTAQASLVPEQHYGPRSDYLGNPGGSPEQAFPVANGGQFRTACEFSHFAYDDPLIHPGKPGASHLHMFFGNTDVNAFSTYESLINSGSSTCNGQELNRTGYWVPAMFDGAGNVRVPDRVVVYYKGEGLARGNSEVYPEGAAMVIQNLNTTPSNQGGVGGAKMTFVCSDNFSANTGNGSQAMPNCPGSGSPAGGQWTVLEVNVKFPQCWNGQDAGDYRNFAPPSGDWYGSYCGGEFNRTLPNLEYFVNYRVEPGENTSNWYLSSDVDATTFGTAKATGGSTSHGDWWGGWHPDVNRMWIDNCVNYRSGGPSGCGFGYLSDGGPNGNAPSDGPALKMRPDYTGPTKIPAATIFDELCPNPGRDFRRAEDAAYCRPG